MEGSAKAALLSAIFSDGEIESFGSAVRGGRGGLIALLDDIVAYPGLYFFELDQSTSGNDLLDLMIRSLVDSPVIMTDVKIPLALQYDAVDAIRELLSRGGITVRLQDGAASERLTDARPMLFAAYYDKAETVRHLLDFGVEKHALDRLILCELRADALSQAQRSAFLSRSHLAEAPAWWRGTQEEWRRLEHDERVAAYLPEPVGWQEHRDGAWEHLERDDQIDFHLFEHSAVTWTKLFGPPKRAASRSHDLANDVVTATLPLASPGMYSSPELFRGGHSLLSQRRTETAFSNWMDPEARAESNLSRAGSVDVLSVSGPQSWALWQEDYGRLYDHAKQQPLSDIHRLFWAVATRRYKLARLLWERACDPVAAAFAAAYFFRNLPDAHMNEDDREGFANQYDALATAVIKRFQEVADSKQETSFLQQFLYFASTEDGKETHDGAAAPGGRPSLRRLWSMPGESMRNLIAGNKSIDTGRAKAGVHPLYGCLSASQRHKNAAIRDALMLMGFEGLEPTRLDMAVTARCKMVLSLDSVEEFMDRLWSRPTYGRTRVLERVLLGGVAPRLKCVAHICFESLFLLLFVAVFFGLEPNRAGVSWAPSAGVPIECCFWFWVATLVLEELRQLYHAGRSSLYIASSVNKLDVVVMAIFLAAFVFHIIELRPAPGSESGEWVRQLHAGSHRIMHGLLCVDVILVAVRLLYMLAAVSRRLAILLIMSKRMISQDVRPFLVFAAFVVVSFELAAYHFSHTLQVSHRFLSFFDLVLDVGELDGIDPRGPFYSERLEWDVPSLSWRMWLGLFKVVYVIVAVVVLMNLLIAMMSNTYSRIQEQSTTEWRLLFAELVKEYSETPLLPPPFSVLQYSGAALAKLALRCRRQDGSAARLASTPLTEVARVKGCTWGRHLSPTTSFMLSFQLDVAQAEALAQQKQ